MLITHVLRLTKWEWYKLQTALDALDSPRHRRAPRPGWVLGKLRRLPQRYRAGGLWRWQALRFSTSWSEEDGQTISVRSVMQRT